MSETNAHTEDNAVCGYCRGKLVRLVHDSTMMCCADSSCFFYGMPMMFARKAEYFDRAPETSRRIAAVELCLKLGYVWRDGAWVARQFDKTMFKCGRCSAELIVNTSGMFECPNLPCGLHGYPRKI